jgi:uncharacterized integral membrane protein
MTAEALQAAFNFTPADLPDNRAGKLSPTQQARMSVTKGRGQIVNIVMGVIFIAFIVVIAVVVLPQVTASQDPNSSAVPSWIIVLVIAVVVGIIALSFLRTRRKLTNLTGEVLTVEGVANTRARAFAGEDTVDMIFRLSIGKMTFAVPGPQQLDAFEDGKTYRGYYVKGTLPILVSAEAL